METFPLPEKEKSRKRIALLSDMHRVADFPAKAEEMREAAGDINIVIGDAVDSEIRSKIIGEFKRDNKKAVESLDAAEKEIHDSMIADGVLPVRAYWMSKVQVHPELLQDILIEVDNAYELFIQYFSKLPNGKWLYGNIEQGFRQNLDFKDSKAATEKPDQIEAIDKPGFIFEDDYNIVAAFPSMPLDEASKKAADEFFADLENKVAQKPELKNLIIIAHENLFRGRSPEKFKEKMAEAGIDKYYIPFYMPNNYRKEILGSIFKVPEGVSVKFIYGHLHDPKEVTQKGIEYKDSDDGLGMKWGVNTIDPATGQRRTRQFDMYQLPFQSVNTIDIEGGEVKIKPLK